MKENKRNVVIFMIILVVLIIAIVIGLIYSVSTRKKNIEMALNSPEEVINAYMNCINGEDYDGAYELLTSTSKSKIT